MAVRFFNVTANSELKKNWVLTADAFAKLLAAFSPDAERAAAEYESTRARLVKMFRWRGVPDAETAADETFNRVARKIDEGEQVRDLAAFVGGVARFVLLENFKGKDRRNVPLEDAPAAAYVVEPEFDDAQTDERKLACFNRCLADLPGDARRFVVDYYNAEADGAARIEHRRRLAERLDLEMNALRNRALRARAKLEDCIKNCLGEKS
jgi:DNA-directed RNA polymerase specialized sigma24 family protein